MRVRDSRVFQVASVILIIIAAAILRFWGLRWGLPNSLHSYSYHPDEFLILGAAGSILMTGFPRFYNYPSLFVYLVALGIMVGSGYGAVHGLAQSYLCARVIAALMGVGAVAAAYWAGKLFWGRVDGILAALVLCVAPLHVQHSHFATVDVPSTLLIGLCLAYCALVLKRGSWRDYILCGVAAGLAAGTKYNAGIVILSLVAAHFLGDRERGAGLLRLLAGLGCSLVAFVVSTPGSILRSSEFLTGLTYEMRHSAAGHGLVFVGTGNGFIYTFKSSLWYGLGPALAVLFVVSVVYALYKMDRRTFTILAFVIPYYAMISLSQVRFARYTLPMFPAAALLIGWMISDIWSRSARLAKWALACLLTLSLAGTLLYTIALDRLFVQPPPQDRAARWIFAKIPKGSRIGVVDVPWFYSPPYTRDIGMGTLPQRQEAMGSSPYKLEQFPSYESLMKRLGLGPEWAVLSDYEVSDAIRIGLMSTRDHLPEAERREYLRIWQIRRIVAFDYARRAVFRDRLSALGISFGSTQFLPHDMRYPAPTIWIYERKK